MGGAKKLLSRAGGSPGDYNSPVATRVKAIDTTHGEQLPVTTPIALDALVGQDDAVAQIDAAIVSDRLHHAWIFHGPSGVGKFTAALAFAAIALDPSSAADLTGRVRPDPDSPTQRRLASGTHADLHIIVKELARFSRDQKVRDQKQRNIPLEVVKEFLIEPAGLTGATEGALASKVFIVDEAELLAREGQNALLKTLEEPPPGTLVILVSSAADRLVPTIRSRCSRVAFRPLSHEAMQRWISDASLDVPAGHQDWLLEFAAGSPGQAMLALTTGLPEWCGSLEPMLDELIAQRHPIHFGSTIDELIKAWSEQWVAGHRHASKDAANKAAAGLVVRFIASHLRARLRSPDADAAEWAARALELLDESHRLIDASVRPIFAFENWAAQLACTPAR